MNEEKRERREKGARKEREKNEKGTRKERESVERAVALVVAAIMLMYSSKRDFFIRKRGRKKGRRHRKEKS